MNPTLLLLLLIVATAAPVATPAKCEASPEVKAKLAEVTRESEALDLSAADSASLVKRLQSIADQYPNDAYAQHALAHMRRRDEPLEPTLAAYRERAATGAPMQLMLYGEVLTFTKGAEAVELLTRAIKADPTLAPAYLALAVLYGHHPTLMSKAKLKSTIDAYVKLCPQSLLGYDWVAEYASQPQMALAAKTLRTKLANRADDEAMNAYEALWRLEFAATSMADQAKVRARVSTDADALAKLENPGRFALTTLNRAYVLAGREADSSRREEQIFKRFPKSRVAQQHLSKLCTPLASPVADDALPEQVLQYRKAQYDAALACAALAPDSVLPLNKALQAAKYLPQLPTDAVQKLADTYFALRSPQEVGTYELLQFAQLFAIRHLDSARALVWVQQALETLDTQSARISDWDEASTDEVETYHRLIRSGAFATVAEIHWRNREASKLRDAIGQMKALEQLPAQTANTQTEAREVARRMMRTRLLWEARLDTLEGHKVDALARYQRALFIAPTGARDWAFINESQALHDDSSAVWKDTGGSPDAYAVWAMAPADEAPRKATASWQPRNQMLPPFSLEDLSGKTWSLATLKGKITFINVWATWCGPCRAEQPHIKQLFERLAGRRGVQVISFNADDNIGDVSAYLKEASFAFPVIPAARYVMGALGTTSIPRNLIVKDGKLIFELVGFAQTEQWVESTIAAIDQVASKK